MDLGDRSRWTLSTDCGLRLSASFCCFLNASMNGIRVRIAVNSVYTPSVLVAAVTEKHLARRRCAGRRAARRHPERRGIVGGDGLAMGRGTAWDSVVYFVGL